MSLPEARTIGDVPRRAASLWGRRTAIWFRDRRVTFSEMSDRVTSLASGLAARVSPGERVALLLENRPEFYEAWFAVPACGAVTVPLNTFLAAAEIAAIVRDGGVRALIASTESLERLAGVLGSLPELRLIVSVPSLHGRRKWRAPEGVGAEVISIRKIRRQGAPLPRFDSSAADRMAVLVYTSGTTGTPKGVMLSHRNLLANAAASARAVGVTPRDRVLVFLPVFHSFTAMVGVLVPMMRGMSVVLCEKIDRGEIKRAITRRRPTIVPGVPAVFAAMAQARIGWLARRLNPVRLYISGGAPLSTDTLRAFEMLYRRPLCEGYGLSEASPVVSLNPPRGPRKAGSVGLPLPGVRVRLKDGEGREVSPGGTGEICVQADSVMQGYFGRPEETASALEAGLLRTGDLGRFDDDGYLFVVGRIKEMMICRGMNVYPREIEAVLEEHPGVKEAAVIGVPDQGRGEVPFAFVVPNAGRPLSESELRRACAARLARYKVPRTFRVVPELPRNEAGKVLKSELRLRAGAAAAQASGRSSPA